ncbi:MAG TPA: Ig-like domain-containing protein, partial [Candidatus Paceibacterota bacterium]|nr:Ig-like domain-containing protein [Candidatus Paceibacterota bacterium]
MNKIKKVISLGIALLASVVFFSIFAGSEARAAANINIDSAKINSSNTVLVKFADPGGNLASVDATKWHIDVGGGGMTPLTPSNAAVTSAGTSWTVTLTFTGTSFSNKAKMYSATEGLYADASAVTDMNGDTNTVVSQTDSIAIADGQAPTLTIGLSDDSLTKNQTALVSFVFSEETAGFDANDVTVQNGTLGTIDSSNPLVQLATFTPTADTTDATNVISVATSWQDKNGNAPAGTISSANYSVLTNDQNGGDEGTNPPTSASISINAGAVTTSSLDVSLTLAATGATQMLISNNSGFSGASWMSLATSKSWTLTSGDGVKTVYAKFKSGSGGVSSAVSDTITVSGSGTNAGVPSDDTAGGCS